MKLDSLWPCFCFSAVRPKWRGDDVPFQPGFVQLRNNRQYRCYASPFT